MNYKSIIKAGAVTAVAAVFCVGCGNPAGNSGGGKGGGNGGDPDTGNPFDGYTGTYGSVSYGGKEYKTVKIGTQTWFAENLNYDVPNNTTDVCYGEGSEVYVSDEATGGGSWKTLSAAEVQTNCTKYGRLYNWATAMGINASYNDSEWNGSDVKHQGVCPTGWHLPSDAEWTQLTDFVGEKAGTKLKSSTGWYAYSGVPAGTNGYGLSALPGGYGDFDGSFYSAGNSGFWWSATEGNAKEGNANYAYYRIMIYNTEDVIMHDNYKDDRLSVRCVQD